MSDVTAAATAPLPIGAEAVVEERGRTRIDDRVVRRIAAAAVNEIDAVGRSRRRVLGVPLGGRTSAQVEATVQGSRALLDVSVALAYPTSVRDVAQDIRAHTIERVQTLTGMQVAALNITVTGFVADASPKVR